MTILIIGVIAVLVIFFIDFKYKQNIEAKKNANKDNVEDFSFGVGATASTNMVKIEQGLTPLEKATAVKTLEKMGYEKVEIIKLLGEDVYDN